jgi:hypothetical protein
MKSHQLHVPETENDRQWGIWLIRVLLAGMIFLVLAAAKDWIGSRSTIPPKGSPFIGRVADVPWHLILHPRSHKTASTLTIGDDSYYFATEEFDSMLNGRTRVFCNSDGAEKGWVSISSDLANGSKLVVVDLAGRARLSAELRPNR